MAHTVYFSRISFHYYLFMLHPQNYNLINHPHAINSSSHSVNVFYFTLIGFVNFPQHWFDVWNQGATLLSTKTNRCIGTTAIGLGRSRKTTHWKIHKTTTVGSSTANWVLFWTTRSTRGTTDSTIQGTTPIGLVG